MCPGQKTKVWKEVMNLVVLISGHGSNLQALIDTAKENPIIQLSAVISDQKDAFGLERARRANIPAHVIDRSDYPNRVAFETALIETIDRYQPGLISLAGFMRILSPDLVAHYYGRIINIHPSLLPKYPGLNTFTQALEAGDKECGTSIHFVTSEVDSGPLICQAKLAICTTDTVETLKQRVQKLEHCIYPTVINWFANKRLQLTPQGVQFDNKLLDKAGIAL